MPGLVAETFISSSNDGGENEESVSSQSPDRIRVKNRRKRYLDLHPEYFGPELELAGVLMTARVMND